MIEIDSIRDALIAEFLANKRWQDCETDYPDDAAVLADIALQVIKDWTAEEPST